MSPRQQSIFVGGLVTGVLSTSYLGLINVLCCAGIIIGGLAAVWHYTSTQHVTIESGDGAVIGALAGIVGAVISGLLDWAVMQPLGLDAQSLMQDWMMTISGGQISQEQLQQMQQQRGAGQMILGFVVSLVLASIFGAIGGAIGAAVFQKGDESQKGDEAV